MRHDLHDSAATVPGQAAPHRADHDHDLTPDSTTPTIAGSALLGDKGQQYEAESDTTRGQMQAAAAAKKFSGIQAKAAMRGVCVDKLTGDDGSTGYFVAWRGLSKACATLTEVCALLERMGVPS